MKLPLRCPHRCPKCGGRGKLARGAVPTRRGERRRRYACPKCRERWTSYEILSGPFDLLRRAGARKKRA